MRGYLEKFGGNFLVASMIPALGFVVSVLILFYPILSVDYQTKTGPYHDFDFWLLVTIPTLVIGFTLTTLNTYILKFYEGYVFIHLFSWKKRNHERNANSLRKKCNMLYKRIKKLEKQKKTTKRNQRLLNTLKNTHYALSTQYDLSYPPSPELILPTEFGNKLRASEAYSGTRYGIDGVLFWPRLMHVIPKSYQEVIEMTRNELSFLVNLSLLAALFSFLCAATITFIIISPLIPIIIPTFQSFPLSLSYQYILIGSLAAYLSCLFYKASLYSVDQFGMAIRSSYDLFRLELIKQFHLRSPKNYNKEFAIWANLTQLIALGPDNLSFTTLKYEITPTKTEPEE